MMSESLIIGPFAGWGGVLSDVGVACGGQSFEGFFPPNYRGGDELARGYPVGALNQRPTPVDIGNGEFDQLNQSFAARSKHTGGVNAALCDGSIRFYRRGAHVAFLDESGLMLQPLVRRTRVPRGQRMILRCSADHDRVSAIRCVTLSPQARHVGWYSGLLLNRNFHGEEVVEFLQYLTRKVPGPWTVVWDGNNLHSKSTVVKAWLAKHPKVMVETVPSDDPPNNPDEWVWSWAKYGKLCNFCPTDVEWLLDAVFNSLEELKHQPTLLASFVMDAGVPLCL